LRDNSTNSYVGNLLEDCAVKESIKIDNISCPDNSTHQEREPTQNSSDQVENASKITDLNDTTQENILDLQSSLNADQQSSNLAGESTKETSLMNISGDSPANQSVHQETIDLTEDTKNEIDLMDLTHEDQSKEEEIAKSEQMPVLDRINQQSTESPIINQDLSNVSTEKSEFFKDLNEELNKTVEDFLSENKPETDQTIETPTIEQTTRLEDFVTKD